MANVHVHELMTDEDFIQTIEDMQINEDSQLGDLLKAMNENRIISWEEAERILQDSSNQPVKSSLPEQTRPTEPDNDTDVEKCIQRLLDNDPTLKEINLNNMKRTPVPQIKRLIEALAYNEYCERISLANMGLYDHDVQVLITVVEMNQAIKKLNLETNYLSGDYFSKLFKAALVNMTLEEIKAVNQGVSFSTTAEKEIIESIMENKGLIKVSVNLRLPEGRHKIEKATLRNGEIRRMIRREAALKAKQEAEQNGVKEPENSKPPVPKPAKEPVVKPPVKVTMPQPKERPAPITVDHPKPKPLKKLVWPPPAEEEPEPMEPFKKGKPLHSLARRESNADQSATPVLNMGGEKAPIRKMADEIRRNSMDRRHSRDGSPKPRKLSGITTASVTERASRESEKDVDDDDPKSPKEGSVQKAQIAMAWRRPSSILQKKEEPKEEVKPAPVMKQFVPVKKEEPVEMPKDDKPKPAYLVRREAREAAEKEAAAAEAAWKAAEEELKRKIAEAEALMKAAQAARLAAEAAKPKPLPFLNTLPTSPEPPKPVSPEPPKEKPTPAWRRPPPPPADAPEEKAVPFWKRSTVAPQNSSPAEKPVPAWKRNMSDGVKAPPPVPPKKSDMFSVNGLKSPLSPVENGTSNGDDEPSKKKTTIIKKKIVRKKRPSERSEDGSVNGNGLEEITSHA